MRIGGLRAMAIFPNSKGCKVNLFVLKQKVQKYREKKKELYIAVMKFKNVKCIR